MKVFFFCGSNVTDSISKEFCGSFLFFKSSIRIRIRMKQSDKIKKTIYFYMLIIKFTTNKICHIKQGDEYCSDNYYKSIIKFLLDKMIHG